MASHFFDRGQQPIHTPIEGLEALRQQLFCTYMELDYLRKASKVQAKLTDVKLQQLQAMLDATVKERDGAFQECKKLRQCLLHLSNNPLQPIQHMYPSKHAASMYSSMDNSVQQHLDTISEVHDKQSARTLSNTQHPQSNMLTSVPFQENNIDINTLEQDELTMFDEDNSWQMDTSFHNSNEQFSMAISSAFDELDTLELPELQEEKSLVSEWEADLTKARLSSPSSADSTAASQLLSKGNAKNRPLVPDTTTSGSSMSTKSKGYSLISDPISIGSQSPIATMKTPSSASSTSGSQSASAKVYMSTQLSILAHVSPSTSSVSTSQSASPIATMPNHLPMSAKPTVSLLAMSASQSTPTTSSAYSPARIPNWFPMPAKLNSSITSTSAPTPPALATPAPMSQSAPTLTCQCSSMIQEASMPSFTESQSTIHLTPLRNGQSERLFPTPSPHLSTVLTKHPLSKINQKSTSTLPQKRHHLPEPPEANMDTMLSSLPKKGKLLEAVMRAGPLLQQLILAGPMPQWQHPPPQLNTAHIPRVPTSPNSVLSPFSHAQYSPSCVYASQFPFTSTL